MKIKNNIMYLSFAVISCISSFIYSETTNISDQVNQASNLDNKEQIKQTSNLTNKEQVPMPSIEELFGNKTEEELAAEIENSRKVFESMSPEELEEFSALVDETWKQMSDNDKQALESMADKMKNSPYLQLHGDEEQDDKLSEEIKEPTKTTNQEKYNKVEEPSNNSSIKAIINNINKQIDDIINKINSNKDLIDEFTNNWPSKFTFNKLKQQLLTLNDDRFATKLTAKKNAEEKELTEELEKFYKDIVAKNNNFYVEDTFGLPSESKKQDSKQLKQLKEVLNVFDNAISNTVMPKIEKFFKKYDPEALELAKEAAKREESAKAHVKDASVKHGSAPAIPAAPEPVKKSKQSQYDYNQYGQGYYDQYPSYGNYSGEYGSHDKNYPSGGQTNVQEKQAGKKDEPKKDESKKAEAKHDEHKKSTTKKGDKEKDEEKDEEKKDKKPSPFRKTVDIVENYLEKYEKSYNDFIKFLKNDLTKLPSAKNLTDEDSLRVWLDDTFANYTAKVNSSIKEYSKQIEAIDEVSAKVISEILNITNDSDLKKLSETQEFKDLNNRVKNLETTIATSINAIKLIDKQNKEKIKEIFTIAVKGGPKTLEQTQLSEDYYQACDKLLKKTSELNDSTEQASASIKRMSTKITKTLKRVDEEAKVKAKAEAEKKKSSDAPKEAVTSE